MWTQAKFRTGMKNGMYINTATFETKNNGSRTTNKKRISVQRPLTFANEVLYEEACSMNRILIEKSI